MFARVLIRAVESHQAVVARRRASLRTDVSARGARQIASSCGAIDVSTFFFREGIPRVSARSKRFSFVADIISRSWNRYHLRYYVLVFRWRIIDTANRVHECANNITCFAARSEHATRGELSRVE